MNTNFGLEVPRNVTFQNAEFVVEAKEEFTSPGQVSLDINQDGTKEWAFEGQGFGIWGFKQCLPTTTQIKPYPQRALHHPRLSICHSTRLSSVHQLTPHSPPQFQQDYCLAGRLQDSSSRTLITILLKKSFSFPGSGNNRIPISSLCRRLQFFIRIEYFLMGPHLRYSNLNFCW